MATDTQIIASQVEAAPLDYTIPGNAELLLKAVNASYTDNGAAGDWLPAVVLISDSGHVIARAVDPGVKVTAGSDAEVSWFPGVKAAAAAAATTGVELAEMWFDSIGGTDPPVSIPNNALTTLTFPNARATTGAVFNITGSGGTFNTISLRDSQRLYLCYAGWQWANTGITVECELDVGTASTAFGYLVDSLTFHGPTPNTVFTTGGVLGTSPVWSSDTKVVLPATPPLPVHSNAYQNSGVSRDVVRGYVIIMALPFTSGP